MNANCFDMELRVYLAPYCMFSVVGPFVRGLPGVADGVICIAVLHHLTTEERRSALVPAVAVTAASVMAAQLVLLLGVVAVSASCRTSKQLLFLPLMYPKTSGKVHC